MNHEYYEDLISAQIDGLLTEEEEQELEEHLASCPDCRRARREMDTVHHLLLAASPLPPEGLEDRILNELPEQPKRRSPWMRKAAPLAAAAVFLLAVVGITKTVANFHDTVGSDVVQAEAVQAEEETEEASETAKTEGAKEDKDSVGSFGKDKKEEAETEGAAEETTDQKTDSAAQNKDKTPSQSKDKKTGTAASAGKKSDSAKSDSKKTEAAQSGQTNSAAQSSQAKPAASAEKPAVQETTPDASAQPAESQAEAAGGGGASAAAEVEVAVEEVPAEAPETPPAAPEPAAGTTAAPAAAVPEPEDEDPEAPVASTITWQQARDRLDAYLDGPQDDLTALGMDNSGTHWLFSTGGKTYAVDIHTGAVSQR